MVSRAHLPITVGVDRSPGGEAAVQWGARQAALRRVPLHMVSAYHWSMAEPWSSVQDPTVSDLLRATSMATLDRSSELIRRQHPDVIVTPEAIEGHPPHVIASQAELSQLIVVGAKHPPNSDNAAVGSVATAVAAHAGCPSVIVPPHWDSSTDGALVVGLDPGRDCGSLVTFALDFGRLTHHSVRFVVCRQSEPGVDTAQRVGPFPAALGEQIAKTAHHFADVEVRTEVLIGNPAATLAVVSADANLLILGRHRRLGPFRRRFGSVGAAALRSATCPVAVVPDADAMIAAPEPGDATRFWAADYGFTSG